MSARDFFEYHDTDCFKSVFYEQKHIYKSLYPDIVPSVEITVHVDSNKLEDAAIHERVIAAAYHEYLSIVKERLNAVYGFIGGAAAWNMKGDAEHGTLERNDRGAAADQAGD